MQAFPENQAIRIERQLESLPDGLSAVVLDDTPLDASAARVLAQHRGPIQFSEIDVFLDSFWNNLSKHTGDIYVENISISEEQVQKLKPVLMRPSPARVLFSTITTIPVNCINALQESRCKLTLTRVHHLNIETALALSRIACSELELLNLKQIDPISLSSLGKFAGHLIVGGELTDTAISALIASSESFLTIRDLGTLSDENAIAIAASNSEGIFFPKVQTLSESVSKKIALSKCSRIGFESVTSLDLMSAHHLVNRRNKYARLEFPRLSLQSLSKNVFELIEKDDRIITS
jgi:hypothetical protein